MTGRPIVAVTGATGMLGSHLCRHFEARKWQVRVLVREPRRAPPEFATFRCELPHDIDPAGLAGADVVIHCAYATRERDEAIARSVNERGTQRILELAREAGVGRFVFVSSIAASDDAPSYYGRSKRALERLFDERRDLILRPGLILASCGHGLFQRLTQQLASSRIVPMLGAGRQTLQTIHVDDLCEALERAIANGVTGTVVLAEPEGICFQSFVAEICKRLGRRTVFIPIPFSLGLLALRACEWLSLPLPVSSENARGLQGMRFVASAPDLRRLGVTVRNARESLDALLGTEQTPGARSP